MADKSPEPVWVAKTVDEYIAHAPAQFRGILSALRAAIRAAAPNATELISYRIPSYKLNGSLVHFAAFMDHCSFITVSNTLLQQFRDELKPFKISGTTIHFTPQKPLPPELVKKIVLARAKENEERTLGKVK
jgi:uncharacterized protein YdhG (YjbR/CyaY superfamily)